MENTNNIEIKEIEITLANNNILHLNFYDNIKYTVSELNSFANKNKKSMQRVLYTSTSFNYIIDGSMLLEMSALANSKVIKLSIFNKDELNKHNNTVKIILGNQESIGIADFLLLMRMNYNFEKDKFNRLQYTLCHVTIEYDFGGVNIEFIP